jgi:hypothetical protein
MRLSKLKPPIISFSLFDALFVGAYGNHLTQYFNNEISNVAGFNYSTKMCLGRHSGESGRRPLADSLHVAAPVAQAYGILEYLW